MKKITSLILIISMTPIFCQDYIITKDGKELAGKYVSHDMVTVVFLYKGGASSTKVPIINIAGVKLANGKMLNTKELVSEKSKATIKSRIMFKGGKKLEGVLDKESFDLSQEMNNNRIKFKTKFKRDFRLYNLDNINFIKSWNGSLIYPKGVIGNKKTNTYHLPTVKHLPNMFNQKVFDSEKEAKNESYNPCSACFDNSPSIPDYNLEQSIVRATIISFQNYNEILYEHPQLPELRTRVDNILLSWPETLKGYDYRIQIFRDKAPNAMAIGGGNLYVSTGLLDMIEDPIELESVIAHEIGHVERRHSLRQFYEIQKKQSNALLATLFIGVAVAAAGGDAEDVSAATTITAAITNFAAELVLKGYSRELEQEADIMAQLYLNGENKSTLPMVYMLDKLATHTISREGYLNQSANAFSDHPSLFARMNQVERSVIHKYDSPLIFSATPFNRSDIAAGFFELEINYLFKSPSSVNPNENLFFVLGTMKNNHPDLSFRIEKLSLLMQNIEKEPIVKETTNKMSPVPLEKSAEGIDYLLTNNGKELAGEYVGFENGMAQFRYQGKKDHSSFPIVNIKGIRLANGSIINAENALENKQIGNWAKEIKNLSLEGLEDQISIFDSSSEFMGIIRSPMGSSGLLFTALKNKKVLINSIGLSAVVLEKGQGEVDVAGYKSINCSMTIR